jgi:hypothetical protein
MSGFAFYSHIEGTCNDHSNSLRRVALAHNTSLATPLFIEVYVPIQDIQRTYICVLAYFHDFDV